MTTLLPNTLAAVFPFVRASVSKQDTMSPDIRPLSTRTGSIRLMTTDILEQMTSQGVAVFSRYGQVTRKADGEGSSGVANESSGADHSVRS
jgi:hypothetical protein